jgi:signal transduction histidine kinase
MSTHSENSGSGSSAGVAVSPTTPLEIRQAAELETVYRTAPIGLALFDPVEFRYLRANDRQAEFFSCTPEELIGKTVTEMAPIPGVRELFESVAAGNPVINYPLEGELVGRPGEYRYWLVNYNPVYAADGTIQAISAASVEITREKKAEIALIENERMAMIGRLASSISHEINNPLEAVTNLLYLIRLDARLTPETRSYVELAQQELARIAQIATQSLRFQRRSGERSPVDCSTLVDPVLQLFERKLLDARIAVVREYRCTQPVVCVENEIKQVLSNLIENAMDAMQNGGTLRIRLRDTVSARTGQPGVRISIADTGHGIPRQIRAHIFDPFFTTKAMEGNGLGLWISAGIVERHHGTFSMRSSQLQRSRGTVFSVFLPAEDTLKPQFAWQA